MIAFLQALMWLTAFVNFMGGALIYLIFRKEDDASARTWTAGCVLMGLGMLILSSRQHLPDVIGYLIHNFMMIYAMVLFRNSFWRFANPRFKASIVPVLFCIYHSVTIWMLIYTPYKAYIGLVAAVHWTMLYAWILYDSFRLERLIANRFFKFFEIMSFCGVLAWGARIFLVTSFGIESASDRQDINVLSLTLAHVVLMGQQFVYFAVRLTDERNKKIAIEKLNASLGQMWRERAELIAARHADRENLLRDMHDGFGSQLSSLHILARKGRISPDEFARSVSELTADLHLVVDTLRQPDVTLSDGLADLKFRIGQRCSDARPMFHWRIELDSMPDLPSRSVLHVLRIIQEAINNAMKHADARHISVSAVHDPRTGELVVRVVDDGTGFSETARKGRGLLNMQNRAREIGGTLEIRKLDHGTEVVLVRAGPNGKLAEAFALIGQLPAGEREDAPPQQRHGL